jgi:hypothetical protein
MFFESLESRTFLSASAVDSQVVADRLQIHADLLKFRADVAECQVTLYKDCQTLKKDDVAQDSTLAPLFTTLHTDVRHMRQQLAADLMTEGAAVLKDQRTILRELWQIFRDRKNSTALTADHAQLLADRIQLQDDELAGLNARLQTRENDFTTISNDLNAIVAAVQSDPDATAQVQADVQKFVTDRTNCLNTISADLQMLITDRTQLTTDLTALES